MSSLKKISSPQKSDIESFILTFPQPDKKLHKLKNEYERALNDLSISSCFKPVNDQYAPYCISMSIHNRHLMFKMKNSKQEELPFLLLSLSPYRRIIKDYFMIIDSYEAFRTQSTPSKLETIDMARRGIHNEAAEIMQERLKDKIEIDLETARRLFTLICVLYLQTTKNAHI